VFPRVSFFVEPNNAMNSYSIQVSVAIAYQ
jgi:hypothetical protein